MSKTKLIILFAAILLVACSRQPETLTLDHIEDSKKEIKVDSISYFKADVDIEIPANETGNPYVERIRKELISLLFPGQSYHSDLKLVVVNYIDMLYAEYLRQGSDFEGNGLAYEEQVKGEVPLLTEELMQYLHQTYVYSGGAHGLGTEMYYLYNLTDGSRIKQSDIFKSEVHDDLQNLLISSCKVLESQMGENSQGFWYDQIVPNENFELTEDGLLYHYNPYEIAPYSMGSTVLLLPKEKIKQYLKTDTEVYKFLFDEK